MSIPFLLVFGLFALLFAALLLAFALALAVAGLLVVLAAAAAGGAFRAGAGVYNIYVTAQLWVTCATDGTFFPDLSATGSGTAAV